MDQGRIHQIGAPRDVYEFPASRFVADFIGTANLLDGVVERVENGMATVRLRNCGLTVRVPLDRQAAAGESWLIKIDTEGQAELIDGADCRGMRTYALVEKLLALRYEIAAKRGDHDSQYMLGILYGSGKGAKVSYRDAYFWLAVAAKSGDQEAVTYRDKLVPYLSPAELAEVQKAVAEWKPSDAR